MDDRFVYVTFTVFVHFFLLSLSFLTTLDLPRLVRFPSMHDENYCDTPFVLFRAKQDVRRCQN